MALVGVVRHPGGEEGGAGTGAHIGQHVAGLDIIAAEAAGGGKPAPDKGHIVVVPQPAGHIALKVDGHSAVLHRKDGVAQLLCAHQHIVCHGITAEQCLAVIRRGGLGIGPVVVFFCGGRQPLHGGKVLVADAGGIGKSLPVGIIEEQQLGGFCHREDLDAVVLPEAPLREVALHELGLFLLGQVRGKVHHHAHLVQRIGGVGVGREDIGHGGSAHLALGRVHHAGFQVVDAALTLGGHLDALLGTDGLVELLHKAGKAFQLVAIVIGPHHDIGHFGGHFRPGTAAAAGAAQCQCRRAQSAQQRLDLFFHWFSPSGCCTAGLPARVQFTSSLSYHHFPLA